MKNETLLLVGILAIAGVGTYLFLQHQKKAAATPQPQNPNASNPNAGLASEIQSGAAAVGSLLGVLQGMADNGNA